MSDWRDDALCRGFPQAWWFPEQGGAYQTAIFVCSMCPSRHPCLNEAIDNDINHGIWGGLTESGRRSLQRKKKKRAGGGVMETTNPGPPTNAEPSDDTNQGGSTRRS